MSIKAVLTNHPDVSAGAVVGSNISNLGLVLGVTVLIFPIIVSRDSLRIDWPLMMLATILFYFLAKDQSLDTIEGIILFSILSVFTFWLIRRSRREGVKLAAESEVEELSTDQNPISKAILYLILGMLGLYFGAEWLIGAVVSIAKTYGVSEKIISVTVVAFGTSLPELVTSAMAALRKETDISIGNLIGSNIFNILAILGITAMVKPLYITQSINDFDMLFLLGISIGLFPIMLIGKRIGRLKGVLLILFYLFYIFSTIL